MEILPKLLLEWYSKNARQLPWRAGADPYRVWVSEIMLQQTRVETVIPYFERWMVQFPGIVELAQADLGDVLKAWEGLGYYSRARNLHKAAQVVVSDFEGQMPRDPQVLRKLPGIGRYTAAAIGSMAYGLDMATLDGNLKRVLARLFDVELAADSSAGEKVLWQLAEEHLPKGKAGDYNQALMDLGAMVCLPKKPLCTSCPLVGLCLAYQREVTEYRPVKSPKPRPPHYLVVAAVIWRDGKVLLAKRPEKGLLGGMWEFPGGKVESGESLEEGLLREIHEELEAGILIGEKIGIYRHAYTHFRITLHAFRCELTGGEPKAVSADEIRWVGLNDLENYPMGKVDRLIAQELVGRWQSPGSAPTN